MTKRLEKLSKLIPKMPYSADDLNILAGMLDDQAYNQMQAQFDLIQMGTKEFTLETRKIKRLIYGYLCTGHYLSDLFMKLLQKYPRVFLALAMPMENVPLYINRDYLGVFMRWRLLIGK